MLSVLYFSDIMYVVDNLKIMNLPRSYALHMCIYHPIKLLYIECILSFVIAVVN